MKNISVKIRNVLFLIILFISVIPFIQNKFKFIKLAPLQGAITPTEKEFFSFNDWFSCKYQLQEEKYLNESFGFRSFFVRINNQLAFSLFNKAKANGVIVGKKNYLYEEPYINAYYGDDFIGIDSITHRVQRLKFIQDTLNKLNKNLIVIFAAGKGSFYPEYFPEKYIRGKKIGNYEIHTEFARKAGVNYLDFNKYFIENKFKSKYPLYPQYGIHWSYYGMCIVADSLLRYIEKTRSIDIPNIYWQDIELSEPKESDYDIAEGMNIKFKLKTFKMAYPRIKFQSDSGKIKPSVLVVADSYYWGIFNFGISNVFSNSHFWFYNRQIYPDSYQSPLETSQVNLKEEIDKHDVIILMATEANLKSFGWGFIENTYNLYTNSKIQTAYNVEFQRKLFNLRNYIKSDKRWMDQIIKKAALNKISVDSMLTIDATWQLKNEN
jgi:hypothetical protein